MFGWQMCSVFIYVTPFILKEWIQGLEGLPPFQEATVRSSRRRVSPHAPGLLTVIAKPKPPTPTVIKHIGVAQSRITTT